MSDKVSTKQSSIGDGAEIKLESDDFHDSMVDVSEQIENKSDSSVLSQNVEKFSENVSGSLNYKIKFIKCCN